MSTPLDELRARLDAIDDELLSVLARRDAQVAEIWAWKRAHGLAQVDAGRESALKQRLFDRAATLGLSRPAIAAVLEQIVGKRLG